MKRPLFDMKCHRSGPGRHSTRVFARFLYGRIIHRTFMYDASVFSVFFYFRLRLAEDVFDDGLASFRIVTDCVPALPSTVLAFADVPFPVRSSFRHGISPFRNEQYPNQGDKATEKRNRYQKVIICTSEPRRLIFDYCGAIFALPEAFFFGYSGAIFELSRSHFIDYSGTHGETGVFRTGVVSLPSAHFTCC